jgi:hypothetical protein
MQRQIGWEVYTNGNETALVYVKVPTRRELKPQ